MSLPNIKLSLKTSKYFLIFLLLASCGEETKTISEIDQPTPEQATRMLTQASFGPNVDSIQRVQNIGTRAWFNEQFAKPQTRHFDYVNQALLTWPAGTSYNENPFLESFWQQAVNGDDQLRQRITYALSQIFVISFQNDTLSTMPRSVASYYDMLGGYAFGNYRDLIEGVTYHPAMGIYLSALRNQKTVGARVPDENYAREIMQLFSIGLRQLNPDGSNTTNPATPTYVNDDIKGLAKVFTGLSWAGADQTNGRFVGNNTPAPDVNRDWLPMQIYPQYHETLPKDFLGVSIPANTNGRDSIKTALDTLFNHPNVGPFIGRQLIQRLVTSNPSPAYIGRVSATFNNNGNGVRGDMKAVIKAVLLDAEAITPPTTTSAGKLREPVLRLANWMRAFRVTSLSGSFKMTRTDDTLLSLGQTPMRSPSVFNFFRPEYQAPNTTLTTANQFAPEFQITEEISVFGYLDYIKNAIPSGVGTNREIKANYTAELALAATPGQLVDRINLLLMQNQMSSALRGQILAAISSNANNSAANKVNIAIFMTMASPEFIAQK